LKAKKVYLCTILLDVGGSIYTSHLTLPYLSIPHTLWIILKCSALIHKKPKRLPSSYMLILCSMHTNWQQLDALLKNLVPKVLVGLEQGKACHPPNPPKTSGFQTLPYFCY